MGEWSQSLLEEVSTIPAKDMAILVKLHRMGKFRSKVVPDETESEDGDTVCVRSNDLM